MTASKWLARNYRRISGHKPPPPPPTPANEAVKAAAAGDAARDRQDWNEAVQQYALALALAPDNFPIRVQMGHAFKEAGRWSEAEAAYRAACLSRPDESELRLHLGHVLKVQGRRDEAIEAYVEALRLDPGSRLARNELIAAGGRNFLPEGQYGQAAITQGLSRISGVLEQNLEAIRDWISVSTYPVEAYDSFRRSFPIQPPPPDGRRQSLTVLIEAGNATPAAVRITLTSLLDQRDAEWSAVIRTSPDMREHPVASFARQDARIVFIDQAPASIAALLTTDLVLMVEAGGQLDREAVGWFRYAAARTKAQVIYADHDHQTHDWRYGEVHSSPALHSMPDTDDQETTPAPPLSLLIGRTAQPLMLKALEEDAGAEQRRRTLVRALREALPVAHLPRILSSLRISEDVVPVLPSIAPAEPALATRKSDRILVVIPTRDQADLLRACLDSLRARTAQPEAVDVLVLDNRSAQAEALSLLSERVESGEIEILPVNEPFNWARFNNLAAAARTHDILVFANNDVEILTDGWDDVVRAGLSNPEIAVIGARLLYPDDTIQHAGVVMGADRGRPVHEGLGVSSSDGGPLNRWRRRRQVTAVTGALMAVDRLAFEQVGGFNERLAVGYNDIDLCLRARAIGRVVLYEPALEAIHHESKTRGRNDDGAKTSWDDAELSDLHEDWGDALLADPGKNPHWVSSHSRAFDGYRDLSLSQVLESLDQSALKNPWAVETSKNLGRIGDEEPLFS